MGKYFFVYVTHISCIVSSSNWKMIKDMNRHNVRHMWDRNRYDSNSFLLWQGLRFALMLHFSISTNIVHKKVT